MRRRRRSGRVGFDTNIVEDVGLAAISVKLLPVVASKFLPLDPALYTAVGAGGGYMVGTFMKNKTVQNASIALGLVEFITPMIDNLIGGLPASLPSNEPAKMLPPIKPKTKVLEDYTTLNDYVPYPRQRTFNEYYNAY